VSEKLYDRKTLLHLLRVNEWTWCGNGRMAFGCQAEEAIMYNKAILTEQQPGV